MLHIDVGCGCEDFSSMLSFKIDPLPNRFGDDGESPYFRGKNVKVSILVKILKKHISNAVKEINGLPNIRAGQPYCHHAWRNNKNLDKSMSKKAWINDAEF